MEQKLPRKEDLLKSQQTQVTTSKSTVESPDLKKAKEDAEIARFNLQKAESEINLKLKQEGYQSLEQGLADVKSKLAEAEKVLESARQEAEAMSDERAKIDDDKQKVVLAYKKVKDTELAINARLEHAIKIEQSRETDVTKHIDLIAQLRVLADYHHQHIEPCRHVLDVTNKTLNNWLDILNQQTGCDFSQLTNYLHKQLTKLDNYIDAEKPQVSPDILDELKLDESVPE